MIHLRLTSPTDLTDEVVALLEPHPAVHNLVVARGVALRPQGDAVQCDVERAGANRLLEALTATGLAERGSVAIETIDADLARRTPATLLPGSRSREFEPIWPLIEARIDEGAIYPPSWFALMAMAGVIGSVGILINSQILIVGAMVVGPEYGAIVSLAWGATRREAPRMRDAAVALLIGFTVAIWSALAFGLIVRHLADTPDAFTAGIRPVEQLIDTPNIFSLIVAMVAGVVGVVSLTTARASTMIGVFISVTTIPAAAAMGVSVAYGDWADAGGSLLQLLMNVAVLTIVGAAVLVGQRRVWRRLGRPA